MADLDGVWAKLQHGEEHVAAYVEAFDQFIQSGAYSVRLDFDPETGWHTFCWQQNREPDTTRFALMYGDALTNLRGSLDYLVWQLVLQANTHAPTDRTAFPVVKQTTNWAGASGDRLKGVDPVWVAEIEKLQPYRQTSGDPQLHPLALLDHANNLNKHRTLPAVVFMAREFQFGMGDLTPGDQYEFDYRPEVPVADGAVFLRLRGPAGQGPIKFDLDTPTALFRVGFQDGLGYEWDIADVVAWVRDAIAIFKPAFSS